MRRQIWRAAKWVPVGALALVMLILAGGLSYRAYRHHRLADATAIDPAMGVDEAFFIRVGGVEQWISIRGRRRANPVLLVLHGGPGIALSPMPRNFLWSWTKEFTIVEWDQRGAGKTFGRSGSVGADVTIDRMALDGIEVADASRRLMGLHARRAHRQDAA